MISNMMIDLYLADERTKTLEQNRDEIVKLQDALASKAILIWPERPISHSPGRKAWVTQTNS